MKALVISDLSVSAAELASGAYGLGATEVAAIVLGGQPATTDACDKVYRIELPDGVAIDDAYATVSSVAASYSPDVVLVSPTRSLKVVAGRLAAEYRTAVITDAAEIGPEGAKSLYFGGVADRVQRTSCTPAIYTVAAGVYEAQGGKAADVEEVAYIAPDRPLEVLSSEPIVRQGRDLKASPVVVAAGRGFAEEADLALARDLAAKLDAGLGCSRPLTEGVDWMPKESYIGVSGQILSPEVYIGVGISGQMQHMVGVNSAKTIIAINKDANAPIFKQADIGIVGDLKAVLPALSAAL